MMVKLYVDWSGGVILSEKQAQETVKNEYYNHAINDYNFNEWLSENYDYIDLFNMGEDEKEKIRATFMEEMKETAWEYFTNDGYEKVFVEI